MNVRAGDLPRYGIPNSEVRKLSSELTGKDYEILVWVPDSYTKETERKYPVIYILDAQWDFSNVEASIRNDFADDAIPEVILVGISHGSGNPDVGKMRAHDFLPTKLSDSDTSRGGGAPRFLQFIREGVIPLIEANYRVDDSYRVLGGCSYGGFFVLYTMMKDADLFNAYIALCPSIHWDDHWLLSEQKRRAKEFQSMKTRLWLGVGDQDRESMVEGAKAFYEEARLIQSEDFHLKFRIIEGEAHSGIKAEAYNRSLRFVFGHLNQSADLP